uniref:Uncharacterized protein n=1 Tax=Glossina palpalis gambiensis TaxID=67801 RepID=A0A1B0BED1_9MUSC
MSIYHEALQVIDVEFSIKIITEAIVRTHRNMTRSIHCSMYTNQCCNAVLALDWNSKDLKLTLLFLARSTRHIEHGFNFNLEANVFEGDLHVYVFTEQTITDELNDNTKLEILHYSYMAEDRTQCQDNEKETSSDQFLDYERQGNKKRD